MKKTRSPRTTAWLLAAQTAAFTFSAAAAFAAPSCEGHIAEAAKRYDIPLAVFYAVGLQETGGRNGLQPYTMNIDGRSVVNGSLPQALEAYHAAAARGAKLIDIGCMQINVRYHGSQFSSITEMFDPAHNVDYAARFLRELRTRESSWTLAVARYNAGPGNNPAQKRYVCGVIHKMVASGFGAWTPNAANFCGVDKPAS
jgi:soluble lytic murein transglycosylase-like protein